MIKKCNIDCFGKSERDIYKNNNRCILHYKKDLPNKKQTLNDIYQKNKNSGVLSKFYDEFIKYILDNLFEDSNLLEGKLDKNTLEIYLKSNSFKNKEYNKILKNTIFIPSCIHFPTRDRRDSFDYLKLLNLFGQIHFNYCEFYLSNLDLQNVECFFQDCKFYTEWRLYNYGLLENEDNVIYQTCEFNKLVSNYTPKNQKKLATFDYSQFDYTCKFNENIKFNRVCFQNMLFNTNQDNYNECNKIQNIEFNSCVFEKKFILNKYKIINFKLSNSSFNDKFEFKENVLDKFEIDNSNFEKIVDFFKSEFKQFKIYKSIFNEFVGFGNCQFGTNNKSKEQIAIFKYATFLDFINFRNTSFKSGLDIENINIKEVPNFLNANIEFQNTNRETFRIIKHSLDRIDNHIAANKYFIQEMKKYKEELRKKPFFGNMQEKIVFYINDWLSSFGQSYMKPIFWLIGFIILYCGIIHGYEQNWLYKIYPPLNKYIEGLANVLNNAAKSVLPFSKGEKKGLEFLSLLFYIIFSILIWQIIVSIKRYTKR